MRYLTTWTSILAALMASAFIATDSYATNLAWNVAGGGAADKAANWTPNQIPGLADDLTFGLGNAYTVDWSDTISNVDTIDVSAGDVIFEDLGNTDLTTTGLFEVGDNSGNLATLSLDGGTWTAGSSIRIGFQAADDGRLVVANNATLSTLSSIAVGFRGDGELIINSGTINVAGNLNAASATTGATNGTALVEVDDMLDVSGTTNLGASAGGTATLRVNGGEYTSGGATTIHAGSLLEVLSGTFNANAGLDNSAGGTLNFLDGTLSVTGGAFQPNVGGPTDDYDIDGPSAIEMPHLVLGAGATANVGDDLTVGNANHGMLSVTNGGTVLSKTGIIGNKPGSIGTATVEGAGSIWTNTDALSLGGSSSAAGGTGSLTVQSGGTVEVGDLTKIWSTGTLTINGGALSAHSGLDNSAVGVLNLFDGTLTVTGGAFQPNAGGAADDYVIDGPSAAEMPHLVLGAGATASIGDELTIGDVNRGMLTIKDGATVSGDGGNLGNNTGSTGTVMVDGTGSTWTHSSFAKVIVGVEGSGALTIQNGGMVSSSGASIASAAGSTGIVTVDGAGSTWTTVGAGTSFLNVGFFGDATLNIQNGAAVISRESRISTSLARPAQSRWTAPDPPGRFQKFKW